MDNINFATASYADLEAAGFTVDVRRSQATRKHKSVFGVRPTANKASCKPHRIADANESGRGTIG